MDSNGGAKELGREFSYAGGICCGAWKVDLQCSDVFLRVI